MEKASSGPGELIKRVRLKKGLTQEQLAELSGTTQSAIARFESANYENHSLSMLKRLAGALGWRLVMRLEECSNGQ